MILYDKRYEQYVYAPLYRHSFQFLRPRSLTEAERFNFRYPNPEMIPSTAEKLRYYRYKKALLQREVAKYAELNESTYIDYENPERDYYPKDKLCKIAELLEADVYDLLDDYNRFLFDGQGKEIKFIRKSLNLTQADLAVCLCVHVGTVKHWEQGKIRMLREMYEKLTNLLSKESSIFESYKER